ncbi:hypothetical protein QCA50_018380 [Cerrena zonata]|uniref:Lariat debranching enzyme C-terminal domain-containing protein n=1 Tax=Cerrena zonata TaxID=2478898 RepID=A0AAW0FB82_9APHY
METVRIAVEGCCHGELDAIYDALFVNPDHKVSGQSKRTKFNPKPPVDLLIICGDFQANRNRKDLETMNVPPKFKHMRDFHSYYSGEKKAPVLTIFIGGNHECSSYLKELEYGGWVAPNIYYLGAAGSVWFKGIKISGISGIWNYHSFNAKSHHDHELKLPYDNSIIRSIYHVKPKNFLKTYLQDFNTDIVVSHDWPQGIWDYGDVSLLIRKKPFFKEDIRTGRLGSPLNRLILNKLRPNYYFSSHLHTKFEAQIFYSGDQLSKGFITKKFDKLNSNRVGGDFSISGRNKSPQNDITTSDPTKLDRPLSNESVGNKNEDEIQLDMDSYTSGNKDEIELDMDSPMVPGDETKNSFTTNEDEIEFDMDSPVNPDGQSDEKPTTNQDEIELDMDFSPDKTLTKQKKHPPVEVKRIRNRAESLEQSPHEETYFLALDKCMNKRQYLQILNVSPRDTNHPSLKANDDRLYFDCRSIAINKTIEKYVLEHPNDWLNLDTRNLLKINQKRIPLLEELKELIDYEESKIDLRDMLIPLNFEKIAPTNEVSVDLIPPKYWENNQTKHYCEKFDVPFHKLD